ncbi:MAG: hypothetical protein ABI284_01715 [Nitrosospira sp.]
MTAYFSAHLPVRLSTRRYNRKRFFLARELHLLESSLLRPTSGFGIIAAIVHIGMIVAGFGGEDGKDFTLYPLAG